MKVKILTHGDTDGICSGALALARYPEAEVWFTHPAGLLKDLKDVGEDLVITCDVAISEKDKEDIFKEFSKIKKSGEIIYIDHHPLPLRTISSDLPCTRIVRDVTKSASELIFRHFQKYVMPLNRVALYGAISDYCDETEFVREELYLYDKRTIYLEAGLLSQSLGEAKGDYKFKRELVKELSSGTAPSSINRVVRNAIRSAKKEWILYEYVRENVRTVGEIAIVDEVGEGVSAGKAAKFAIGVTGKKVGIGIKLRNGFVDMSVRKRGDFPMDLDNALRNIAPRLRGSGGGHPSAAGARILLNKVDEFTDVLAREISALI